MSNQQAERLPMVRLKRVASRAVRALRITGRGRLSIAFVDAPTMRRLNRRFLQHRGLTDVLTFRYAEKGVRCQLSGVRAGRTRHPTPVARHLTLGEILVSPTFARQYAQEHGVSYEEELARYVVHGLLHWVGHDDRTPMQQRRMRRMEDELLKNYAESGRGVRCQVSGVRAGRAWHLSPGTCHLASGLLR